MCDRFLFQLKEVESQDALEKLFEDDQNQAAIADTGYRKPLHLCDKFQIASTLKAGESQQCWMTFVRGSWSDGQHSAPP